MGTSSYLSQYTSQYTWESCTPHIDWQQVAGEFARREAPTTLKQALPEGICVAGVERVLDQSRQPDDQMDLLARGWKGCDGKQGLAATFAIYLYLCCQRAWELSINHRLILSTIEAAKASFRRVHPTETDETRVVELVLQHTDSLRYCMGAESAVNCSCPVDLRAQAKRAVEFLPPLSEIDELESDGLGQAFCDFFRSVVRGQLITYEALADVADAVLAWVSMIDEAARPAVRQKINQAVASLAVREKDPDVERDVYASELPAHRQALAAVSERLSDLFIPIVWIDEAKIVYCFPFTLDIDGKEAIQRAWKLAKLGPDPVTVEDLELSDLWTWGGRQDPPYYRGVEVKLPELQVHTTDSHVLGNQVLGNHEVSIRLMNLGNHYLRVEGALRGATLHHLNQATRWASPQMGAEDIESAGHKWESLTDYAGDMRERLEEAFRTPEHRVRAKMHVEAEFHALLEIRAASIIEKGGGRRPVESPGDVEEFLAAAGQLLWQPLRPLATALEEWVRQRVPDKPPNVLGDSGFCTDRVIRTPNTTVLIMPATPHWVLIEYEELAEFIASLPPVLESWREDLDRKLQSWLKELEQITTGNTDSSSAEEWLRRRTRLEADVNEIRRKRATLHSTDLCGTEFHRRLLDSLYISAGLPRVEEELDRTIDRTTTLLEAMSSRIDALEESSRRHIQWFVQGVLSVLAVLGLTGLFGLLNELFVTRKHRVAWLEVTVLLVSAIAMCILVLGSPRLQRHLPRHRFDPDLPSDGHHAGRRSARPDSAS